MTAFLRGSMILADAENSASAVDIGFVSAMPPSLARRDKRFCRLSQGGDEQTCVAATSDDDSAMMIQ